MRGDARAETRFHSCTGITSVVRWPVALSGQTIELIDSGRRTRGHGKALLTEPDHGRRRQLAHRAVDPAGPSATSKRIMVAAEPRPARAAPHPDQLAAAGALEDAVTRALGIGIQARRHRRGYQLLLDKDA